jgi:hypothetical protein
MLTSSHTPVCVSVHASTHGFVGCNLPCTTTSHRLCVCLNSRPSTQTCRNTTVSGATRRVENQLSSFDSALSLVGPTIAVPFVCATQAHASIATTVLGVCVRNQSPGFLPLAKPTCDADTAGVEVRLFAAWKQARDRLAQFWLHNSRTATWRKTSSRAVGKLVRRLSSDVIIVIAPNVSFA